VNVAQALLSDAAAMSERVPCRSPQNMSVVVDESLRPSPRANTARASATSKADTTGVRPIKDGARTPISRNSSAR
jgi:hypothetical protein